MTSGYFRLRGEVQLDGPVREHEEVRVVVLHYHTAQEFFAVIPDAGLSSVKHGGIKRDLHAPVQVTTKMQNRWRSS